MKPARLVTPVAVGLVFRPDGQVLLGSRPDGKPYAGWWEFPGGKLEPGETAHQALVRELNEELGIEVHRTESWVVREYDYPHAYVRLHFMRVVAWTGTPFSREGQLLQWCNPERIDVEPLLPAALQPVRWLGLPTCYAISDATSMGIGFFLERLDASLAARRDGNVEGPGMFVLREPTMNLVELERLYRDMSDRINAVAGARLLVSSRHPRAWWEESDGVHLTSRDLYALADDHAGLDESRCVIASTHCLEDLERAGEAGCDAAVLGPVLETESHPDAKGMGWPLFGSAVQSTPVPCYALGGLGFSDRELACSHGAHGVAARRAAWQ